MTVVLVSGAVLLMTAVLHLNVSLNHRTSLGPNRSSEPTQVTLLAVINTLVLIIAALSVSHAVMGSSLNASILARSQATSTRRQRESRDGKACAPTGTIKQRSRLSCSPCVHPTCKFYSVPPIPPLVQNSSFKSHSSTTWPIMRAQCRGSGIMSG